MSSETNHEEPVELLPVPNHPMQRVQWEALIPLVLRLLVWGGIFGLLYLLRSFFALIFLTFVFAYLQANIVDALSKRLRHLRIPMVILTGTVFLSAIISVGVFLAPKVYQQATGFAKSLFIYLEQVDNTILDLAERYPLLQEAVPELRRAVPPPPPTVDPNVPAWAAPPPAPTQEMAVSAMPNEPPVARQFKDSPTSLLLGALTGTGKPVDGGQLVKTLLDHLASISRQTLGILSTFLLALLLSFLIVLDLPRLTASVRDLENTRLRFIYREVVGNIYDFGKVLGNTIQAQFYIACVNTFLTALGLQVLGMGEHIAFLSVIVFVFSFVPVAGVFISSIPICLIALNLGGFYLVLLSILMITLIHMVEGYVLNPLIYGARLHVNPVIVLIILTVGGKLFGIWGLILGLPVSIYLFGHAIRYQPQPVIKRP